MSDVRAVVFDMGGVVVRLASLSEVLRGVDLPRDELWDRWILSESVRSFEGGRCSVEEFADLAFKRAEMPLSFEGEGEKRVGVDSGGTVRVRVDPNYYRPTEVDLLIGDPTLAKEKLGWEATTRFEDLVAKMVDHDVKLAGREAAQR